MAINVRDLVISSAQSADATINNIDVVVPADQDAFVTQFSAYSEDGSRLLVTIERPAGTVRYRAVTPAAENFGPEGLFIPGAAGDDLRMSIAAGAAGIFSVGNIVTVTKPRSH